VSGREGKRDRKRNLSWIVYELLEAMAHGWRVELVLSSGASLTGVPVRVIEDEQRKRACVNAGGDRSHLLVALDTAEGRPVPVERVLEVKPAL